MKKLLDGQKSGKEVGDAARLDLEAGGIRTTLPEDRFAGHAAWLSWPWKLHRIRDGKTGELTWELYDLSRDSEEGHEVGAENPDRVKAMSAELEAWLTSVVRSYNGVDYIGSR